MVEVVVQASEQNPLSFQGKVKGASGTGRDQIVGAKPAGKGTQARVLIKKTQVEISIKGDRFRIASEIKGGRGQLVGKRLVGLKNVAGGVMGQGKLDG